MSWNGHTVIDMDAHIIERPAEMYRDYIDPAYREPYERMVQAVIGQSRSAADTTDGGRRGGTTLVGSRNALLDQIETGRPLGVRDTFGLSRRAGLAGRKAFPPGREDELPPIRPEVSWDVKARLEDMDRARIDVNVLFPTHVSSYCALRDVGFENALYRTYHRWVSDFCAQAPNRLKWTVVANMRDVQSGVEEVRHWANEDPNCVGIYISPQAPEGKLLDTPDLHPLWNAAQDLDMAVIAHGGTARPPYGPGTLDLDGSWFLLHGLTNLFAGMAALGALIGGGVFDLFPTLRIGCVETGGGWMPALLDRYDTHYLMSPGHVPQLKRMPREVLAEGRYFHGFDTWERSIEFAVDELGEDMWLFATDWPHGDTAWPEGVQQIVERERLTDSAKSKLLGENAMRLLGSRLTVE